MAHKTIDIYWKTYKTVIQNDCLFLLVLLTPVFSNMQKQMFASFLWLVEGDPKISASTPFCTFAMGHLSIWFYFYDSSPPNCLTPVMHPQHTLPPPFFFPHGVHPFGLEQHTPLIASSCLFYWVIGSIMHCGNYLWARMLCSAHWGHSCQQECQREFLILGWTCENYIPG